MTKYQIEIYEYCKDHINSLDNYLTKLPFKRQKYGCGSQQPNIEYDLENLHQKMYTDIINIINETKQTIQQKIDDL